MHSSNFERLLSAATALQPLLPELVFVGGCITGLLITDDAAAELRVTLDVDTIAEITTYAQYAEFGDRLRGLGFHEDSSEDAPLCRWIRDGILLDLMPLDSHILGFSNSWYRAALDSSVSHELRGDLFIRMISAPYFLATKLEAFQGRGHGNFIQSHDLEDIISVVDGRETLVDEVRRAGPELVSYIRAQIKELLANYGFMDALPGFLLPDAASQSRVVLVLARLRELALL